MRRLAIRAALLAGLILVGAGAAAPMQTGPISLDHAPVWNADGTRIGFLRDTVGSWSVRSVPAAGGSVELLGTLPTDGPQESIFPAGISPDWSRVAYRVRGQLRIANVDGSGKVDSPLGPLSSSWSPDSRFLAVDSLWAEIFVLRADGSEPHKVADGFFPTWSPDGNRLAFVLPYARGIAVVDRDGSGYREVWHADLWTGPPAWSPSGDLLAFPGDAGLRVVRLDGTSVINFHGSFGTNIGPSWSFDGTKLAIADNPSLSVFDLRTGRGKRFPYASQVSWAPRADLFANVYSRPCSAPGVHVISATSGATRRLTLDCRIEGTRRGELIEGSEERDFIEGRGGNDRILGFQSADTLFGGPGNDRVNGGPDSDDEGDDIDGGPGNDFLDGGRAQQSEYTQRDDLIRGRAGSDFLRGGPGLDILSGGNGNDTIHARDGQRDLISCGRGRDLVLADKLDRVAADCEAVRARSRRK